MAGPRTPGTAQRGPRGRDPSTALKARLTGRSRCGGSTAKRRNTAARQDLPCLHTAGGSPTPAGGTTPTLNRMAPPQLAAAHLLVTLPPTAPARQGGRATLGPNATSQTRVPPAGTNLRGTADITIQTDIILHRRQRSLKYTLTITTRPTNPFLQARQLCPRQTATAGLAMAEEATHATLERFLTPTHNAQAHTATGPGIAFHVATQKKQQPRVVLTVRPVEKKEKQKRKQKQKREEARRKGRKRRIRTRWADPLRPGVRLLPRRRVGQVGNRFAWPKRARSTRGTASLGSWGWLLLLLLLLLGPRRHEQRDARAYATTASGSVLNTDRCGADAPRIRILTEAEASHSWSQCSTVCGA